MEPEQLGQDELLPRFIMGSWLLYIPVFIFSFVVGKETFNTTVSPWDLFLGIGVIFIPLAAMIVITFLARRRHSVHFALSATLLSIFVLYGFLHVTAWADTVFFKVTTSTIKCSGELELRQRPDTGLPGCFYREPVVQSTSPFFAASTTSQENPEGTGVTWACGKPEDPKNQCPEGKKFLGWSGNCALICR